MTTSKMLDCLTLSTLQQVSLERLHYAVGGLADGSITVHLTRHSESELRALVTNGDGKDYGVTITETLTTCSCRDSLYRGVVCKHAVATALQVLRTAPELKEQPGARPAALPDPIHLMGEKASSCVARSSRHGSGCTPGPKMSGTGQTSVRSARRRIGNPRRREPRKEFTRAG